MVRRPHLRLVRTLSLSRNGLPGDHMADQYEFMLVSKNSAPVVEGAAIDYERIFGNATNDIFA